MFTFDLSNYRKATDKIKTFNVIAWKTTTLPAKKKVMLVWNNMSKVSK